MENIRKINIQVWCFEKINYWWSKSLHFKISCFRIFSLFCCFKQKKNRNHLLLRFKVFLEIIFHLKNSFYVLISDVCTSDQFDAMLWLIGLFSSLNLVSSFCYDLRIHSSFLFHYKRQYFTFLPNKFKFNYCIYLIKLKRSCILINLM